MTNPVLHQSAGRVLWVDYLRSFITVLVVAHHSTLPELGLCHTLGGCGPQANRMGGVNAQLMAPETVAAARLRRSEGRC